MNILILASHAVAEYDDVRMFSDLGYDVFAPGGYEVPSRSGEGLRPPLPDAPHHPELVALCNEQRNSFRSPPGPVIDWAKGRLHDGLIDWADAIIVHHFPDQWIGGQWDRIKHKRVIWRTCGQSDVRLEEYMAQFAGLEIVRYSPAERRHFTRRGFFAGETTVIRFGKYPGDYGPWKGDHTAVGNLSQHADGDPNGRDNALSWGFFDAATAGLPVTVAGLHSEQKGGLGGLSWPDTLEYLQHVRAYLYTGTRPASYTLALMEAMLTGTPTVSIGVGPWGESWDAIDLFEGADITRMAAATPETANRLLRSLLSDDQFALDVSKSQRQQAIALFDVARVGAQWREFLG